MDVRRGMKWIGAILLLACGVKAVSLFLLASARAQVVSAAGEAQAPDGTLYLSDHRYDLPATYVSAAQIQAHKQKMIAAKNNDVPIDMVKMGGSSDKHQAGISIVYREPGVSNQFAVHDDVGEVYYIIEGSGTMLVGGKLLDPVRRPVSPGNGRGISGTKSEGSQEVHLAPGDMLIIPAGTPHKFVKADTFTVYAVVRVDPDGVAPLLK